MPVVVGLKGGPGAPGGAPWAKRYTVAGRDGRVQASFSQGNLASKRIEASCTISRPRFWAKCRGRLGESALAAVKGAAEAATAADCAPLVDALMVEKWRNS